MNSIRPKEYKAVLFVKIIAILLIITALVGISRYLYRHGRTLSTVNYEFAPGYGHRYMEYFGKIRVLVPTEPFNLMDFLTSEFLLISGLTALLVSSVLRRIPHKTDHKLLYLLTGFGFIYLELDEIFKIHEFFGLNLANLLYPNLKGTEILSKDFNGEIIFAYAVIAIVLFLMKLKFFLGNRIASCFLFIGLLFHAFAAALDFIHEKGALFASLESLLGPFGFTLHYDEFYEVIAAFFYLMAIIFYGIHTLSQYYSAENGSYLLKKRQAQGVLDG